MNELFLNPVFQKKWAGRDPFEAAFALSGEEFRRVKNRRTLRFEVDGQGYFAKLHRGVGWREILKNFFQGKCAVLGAQNEYHAIRKLEELGIPTMVPAAYGRKGFNPAAQESFIVTEELCNMTSLEDYCRDWAANPPEFRHKRALIRELGRIAGKMHRAGVNHRDCYICHFLLAPSDALHPMLHVLDLHRAQMRKHPSRRYVLKDVAGLWFSSMDLGLSRGDLLAFVRAYGVPPASPFWLAADRTARRLYSKVHGKTPGKLANFSKTI